MNADDVPRFDVYRIEENRWRFTNFKDVSGERDTHAECIEVIDRIVKARTVAR